MNVKRLRRKMELCAAFAKVKTQTLTAQFNQRFFKIPLTELKLVTGAHNTGKSIVTLFKNLSVTLKMESAKDSCSNAVVILKELIMKCANI